MASILNNHYKTDKATGWYSPILEKITSPQQAQVMADRVIGDARMERLKGCVDCLLGVGLTIVLTGLSFIAVKIATLLIGIVVFPLAIVPPLYGLVTTLGGLAVGGMVGMVAIKKYSKGYFERAKAHWNYADHLYLQAHAVSLKKTEFPA